VMVVPLLPPSPTSIILHHNHGCVRSMTWPCMRASYPFSGHRLHACALRRLGTMVRDQAASVGCVRRPVEGSGDQWAGAEACE
jgi:hypothetical protein